MRLLVATRSPHKRDEIERILHDVPGLTLLDLDTASVHLLAEEDELEPHDTFVENAASKARYYFARSGLPTVADDSGLSVSALRGAPGVRSKRFAPEGADLEGQARDDANNAYLLERLKGIPAQERGAHYVCAAVLVTDRGEWLFEGTASGRVVEEPSGQGGFGYDPLILDTDTGRTFAELSPEEKDRRSHRGGAFRLLAAHLRAHAEREGSS